ncbi:MAG TPA: isocitrate lyase/phosphoenolpyruvate mutase family protein [Planosporangium sp.]|jgi:2-methylisocitrate lyase-like PEP mutase family enzyme|nr:isocitrate lyase/phosphoenolpyruvate mutase family protein [Planosporangium sp.]
MSQPADRFAAFHALHHADRPLFLPNAWDYACAAALSRDGHPAIGTTSLGVAAAAGRPDAAAATRDETLALARRLGRLPSLLTVDIEAGFSDEPQAVANLAGELAAAGAVGVNLEDGRPDGGLTHPAHHSNKIAAIKALVPDLFVNARTDTFWLGDSNDRPPLGDTIRRAAAYIAAGADAVFVPGAVDTTTIALLIGEIDAPLNVLYAPGRHALDELARLGVARVSTGSLLFRVALAATIRAADAVRRGVDLDGGPVPSYADVQELVT